MYDITHPLVELLLTPTVSGLYPIDLLPGVVEITASDVAPDGAVREILRVPVLWGGSYNLF